MNKYFFLAIFFFALVLAGCEDSHIFPENGCPRPGASLVKGPYLLYTNNNTSMTVLWQTDATPDTSIIEWGSTTSYGSSAEVTENSSAESMHQFFYTISGLNPREKIYYKVRTDYDSYASYFRTAPTDSATALSFYAYGDTRSLFDLPPAQQNSVLEALFRDLNDAPDERQTLIINSGDLVMFGLHENSWNEDYFSRDYPDMIKFFSMFPAMIAIGNHEAYNWPNFLDIDHKDAGRLLRKYFPVSFLVDPDRYYYSFDYGPIHFTILDQYTLMDGIDGQTYSWEAANDTGQFAWLKQDLANTTKPWKIVMFHEPAWTALNGFGEFKNNQVMRDYYDPVFEQNGVKVVVQGHVHFYSRCATEEIQYLTLGGGGAELTDRIETDAPAFVTGEAFVYHFARFDVVDNNTLNVTVMDKDNLVMDSFTVTQ